jgi:alpha-aminoadipate carrier protein LysW
MAVETVSGQAQCPECLADVPLTNVMQHEIAQCPGCGAELEVVATAPLTLALAPEEEEDWGE